MKSYLLFWIDHFTSRGYKFYNIHEMSIKTNSDKRNMTYEHHLKQPMHIYERMLYKNIAENPQFIYSLDRNKNHPRLIWKSSHIPILPI